MNQQTLLAITVAAGAALFTVGQASAATITQDGSNGSGENWNTAVDWSNNAAPTAGNDYVSSASFNPLRTTTTSSTFAGNSLTIVSGSQLYLKGVGVGTTSTYTFNNGGLILDGGFVQAQNNNNDESTIFAGNFSVTAASEIQFLNLINGSISIDSVLSGSGNLTVGKNPTNGYYSVDSRFNINNAANTYTGTLLITTGTVLDFGASMSGFGLSINGSQLTSGYAGSLVLDQNISVTSLSIQGTAFTTPGIYTYADLKTNALYGSAVANAIVAGGSGSITVIPEPSSFSLLGLGVFGLIARRRR